MGTTNITWPRGHYLFGEPENYAVVLMPLFPIQIFSGAFNEFTREVEFPFVPVQVSTQKKSKQQQKNLTQEDMERRREYEGLFNYHPDYFLQIIKMACWQLLL